MDMDTTETVGLGQLADKVAALARATESGVLSVQVPAQGLPAGLLIDELHLIGIRDGDGRVRLENIAPAVEALRGKPARRTGTATATTLDSFCALVNRNGDAATAIFVDANWRAPKLTAVLNYNLPAPERADDDDPGGPAPAGDDPLARFGDHRVHYAFPLSEPWKAWIEGNGKAMEQGKFAAFLEDHIHEIAAESDSPEERRWKEDFRTTIAQPSDLLDLSRGLEVNVGGKIKSKQKLQSGETTMVFETEHRGANGEALTIPGLFILKIPVFYAGEPHRVLVRLRYRPMSDGVVWFYDIFRPDEFVDARVREDVAAVVEKTGRDVFDGAPEGGTR